MNAGELARAMAASASTLVPYLLPQGKKAGPEWKVGSVGGEAGSSLSVRLTGNKAGVWSDWASHKVEERVEVFHSERPQWRYSEILRTGASAFVGVRISFGSSRMSGEPLRHDLFAPIVDFCENHRHNHG